MKRHLNYANVIASIALFVALGGSAYAAVKVTGKNVVNNSLTGADVRNSSLTGADVRNGSLGKPDLKNGTLPETRWLLINESGDIEEQSGGFRVVSKPGINNQPESNPNVYVDAGSSLLGKGLIAGIALQNRLDRNGDGTADPAFDGDASVGRCNTTAVACAPAGTNVDNVLVVRALDDNSPAVSSQTRRVYVQVTP